VTRPAPPRVSVVIAAYRSQATVAACLTALRAQTYRDFETVLVNSSPDETARIVTGEFPEVVFEQHPTRLLAQAARNRGVELARGDILVFTDPDCRAHPDWLEHVVAAFDAGHAVVSGSMGLAAGGWFAWGVHLSKFSWLLRGAAAGPCRIVVTANAAYTRRAFERIGPFDSDICIGDALLSWRAQSAGLTPWLEPRAVVEHWHQHRFVDYLREFFHRGRELVVARNAAAPVRPGIAVLHCAAFPATAVVEIVRVARDALAAGVVWPWLLTIPTHVAYKLAWSLGEAREYVDVLTRPRASRPERLKALHT
jgi:glycosyltransferase involved in cell wall biosynthesis